MECPTCKSVNDEGSRFCRECGSRLSARPADGAVKPAPERPLPALSPEEEAQRREKADALLARARAFAAKGGLLEAISTVEEAAGIAQTMPEVHAELARLYESAGSFDKAIAAQKRAVALVPDSDEAKARLDALQREAAARAAAPPESDEPAETPLRLWAPRLGAALAGALVFGIGYSLITGGSQAEPTVEKPVPRMSVAEHPPGTSLASPTGVGVPARPTFTPTLPNAVADPFVSKGLSPTPAPRRARIERDEPAPIRRPRRRSLPRPQDDRPAASSVPPLSVSPPMARSGGGGLPLGGVQQTPPSERISVAPPSERAQRRENEDEGYIKIETHPASGSEKAPPTRSETGNEGEDPAQEARALQGVGRYRDAVASYREAIARGMAAGELHQNLALCYQRLGEMGAARDAYARAIDAYQVQLRRERDPEGAQRGIASCRAALEVLGGP